MKSSNPIFSLSAWKVAEYHDFWWYCLQFLDNYARWVTSQTREHIGSFTSNIPDWLRSPMPLAYAVTTPALDKSCNGTDTLKDLTCTIASAASAALVIANFTAGYTADPSTVTIGGATATLLDSDIYSTTSKTWIYYLYVASTGGSVIVDVTWASNTRSALVAATFTSTATVTPWFEGTGKNNGSGASAQSATCTTTGTSANTLSYIGVGGITTATASAAILITAPTSWTEINEGDLTATNKVSVSTENSYYANNAGTFTSTLTLASTSISWANVCTRILPKPAATASLSDVLTNVDTIKKGGLKSVSESASLVDTLAKLRNVPTAIPDVLSLVDSLILQYIGKRTLTDTLTLTDSLWKATGKFPTETFSILDSILKSSGVNLTNSRGESIIQTDIVSRLHAASVLLTNSNGETLALSESIVKTAGKPFSDTVSLAETLQSTYTPYGVGLWLQICYRSFLDSLAIAAMLLAQQGYLRSFVDIMSFLDSIQLGLGKPLTDLMNLSDALIASVISAGHPVNISDILALSDILSHTVGKPLLDLLNFADTLSKLYSGKFSPSDTLIASEAISLALGKPLFDALALTDLFGTQFIGVRSFTDTLTLLDALVKNSGTQPTESLAVTDMVLRLFMGERGQTDTLTLADLLSHTVGKPLAEIMNQLDLISIAITRIGIVNISDLVTITDSLARDVGKPLVDSIVLNDLLSQVFGGSRPLSETILIVDSFFSTTGRYPSLTDILNLNETITSSFIGQRSIADVLTLTDNVARLRNTPFILSELTTLTDTIVSEYGAIRQLIDVLLFGESINTAGMHIRYDFWRNMAETLTISENLSAIFAPRAPSTITINIQDLFNLTDLIGKLVTPTGFGVTGGIPGAVAPLVQIQLAAIPRIATLDYITTNPMSIQLFLFKPSSILQVLFTATNGNRDSATVNLWFDITLGGKPYMTTSKSQQSLAPGVPTSIYSWLLIDQPGTYEIIPRAEAVPTQPNFSTVTLPTQTVTVEPWQIWITTIILWIVILGPIIAVTVFATRAVLTRRKEAKEAEE